MAVLTWYRENTDKIKNDGTINGTEPSAYFTADKLKKYLNVKNDFAISVGNEDKEGSYKVERGNNNQGRPTWYVRYHIESLSDKKDIIDKLANKAADRAEGHGYLLQGEPTNSGNGNWQYYSNAAKNYIARNGKDEFSVSTHNYVVFVGEFNVRNN